MQKLLQSYWRGEQPLWKTFWLVYVMGGAVYALITLELVLIIASLLTKFDLTFHDASGNFPDIDKAKAVYWLLWASLMLPSYIFGTVSIWRIPAANTKKPAFSYTACVLVILNFLKTIVHIVFLILIVMGMKLPNYIVDLALHKTTYKLPNSSYANADQVMQFAQQAAISVFNYNYNNYQQQFNNAENYFSDQSWKVFTTALAASHNLDEVKDKKLTVSAKVTDYPKLLKTDTFLDQISWLVQIPVTITYQEVSAKLQSTQKVNIKLLIVQSDDGNGLQVAQFITEIVK